MPWQRNYILITAAHNEQYFIEKTIQSVINQNIKPLEWIIVNDSSTDKTEEVVRNYLKNYTFIKLINNIRSDGRDFASKVFALNVGLKNISHKEYNYLGILDADVSFGEEYYSGLIEEFENDPKLGIVGGIFYDIINGEKIPVRPSEFSIRGATQFFRRTCFEQIGGLRPIKYGGEDALACYTARMFGWELKNIKNLKVLHHRPTGITGSNIFRARLRDGFVEYNLGYHPLFQFVKCLSRLNEKPFIIGSLLRFSGYWIAHLNPHKRAIPKELLNFVQKDQLKRILDLKNQNN